MVRCHANVWCCWFLWLTAVGWGWAGPTLPEDHPLVQAFGGKRLDLWSWQPVSKVAVPPMPTGGRNEIDAFIGEMHRKQHTDPLPEADRRVLARRLSFDLTGLPPTPEAVATFVQDPAPDAVEQFVDRLLASEASALHLAAWWLDVVRYADSTGYDWDEFRKQSWRYRDYVIRAFHADKPFDRFVTEQLAGDEIVPGEPVDVPAQDALLATGFLRVGPWDNASKLFGEEPRTRSEWMSDLVETTGTALLGLTFSCCRCHDHKYDPLTQADYYRLRACFESLEFADERPVDLAADQAAIRSQHQALKEQAQPHHEAIERLREKARARLTKDKPNQKINDHDADQAMTKQEQGEREEHQSKAQAILAQQRKFTTALLAVSGSARPTQVLAGGNLADPKQTVSAGIPSFFDPNELRPPTGQGPRSALAAWIVAPENPLTARVLANRLWQLLFGTGLVSSVDDFGFAGATPDAPELLDWLAQQLPSNGWSMRHLLRLMATSRTYRQVATGQRETRLGIHALRRLSAEQLRDAMLLVSGEMLPNTSGPPIWPTVPEDVLQANPATLDDNETKTKGWYPSAPAEQPVRSILLVRKRSLRIPFLETFDLPENFVSCGARKISTVAPQALVLLNSDFVAQTATAFAQRIAREAGAEPEAQMTRAWELALGRAPKPQELAVVGPLWREFGPVAGCRVIFNLNEFVYVD